MKLATVLLYSTIDYRWLNECLKAACDISEEVIVTTCDTLWNGEAENPILLDKSKTIIRSYSNAKLITTQWQPGYESFCWESLSRMNGIANVSNDIEYILFLDTDEIIDVPAFKKWIISKEYQEYDSMRLANYWYFRDRKYRAKTIEDSVVLAKKETILNNTNNIVITIGREQYYELLECKTKKRMIFDTDNRPMVHHYSWVRTKEEMLNKVRSWGHNKDRDWVSLVEEEFSRPFNGRCFVNNYEFEFLE